MRDMDNLSNAQEVAVVSEMGDQYAHGGWRKRLER